MSCLVKSRNPKLETMRARKFTSRPASCVTSVALALALLILSATQLATAQTSNSLFVLHSSFFESTRTYSFVWGDYDGDGDLDLAAGINSQPNQLYCNDGGALDLCWTSVEWDRTRSLAWGDYDGDGDLDLAVGNENQSNRIYRNDGGVLASSAVWSSAETENTSSVAWGDWEGDGDLDLVVGNIDQPNRVYENEGGSLINDPGDNLGWISPDSEATYSVAWGDYDNDGDLDLAVGNNGQISRVYETEGETLINDPDNNYGWISLVPEATHSVAWGNVDDDDYLDLAVGNRWGPIRLYRNSGGMLPDNAGWSSTEGDATSSLVWGDYDSDGDIDLAVGNDLGDPNRIYRNDGMAGDGVTLMITLAWSSDETDGTKNVAWGDCDNDGDLDLVAGNWHEPGRLYRNEATALTTSWGWSSTENDDTQSVAWGDCDGDGDLDLAVGNSDAPNRLYRNNDGTLMSSAIWASNEISNTLGLAWGDYDGDGDLDLAIGNGGRNQLYRNDDGALTDNAVWESDEIDETWGVAWGDYDGDGDLDLAAGNKDRPIRLYHNNGGALTTSSVWSSVETNFATSVAWGDYDNDGDLDLAVGNFAASNRLYHNDNGVLLDSAVWASNETNATRSIAWGDVDGDGDLDLAVGNHNHVNQLYCNDDDSFILCWQSVEADHTRSVAWGDVDSDGDLDLVVGNYNPHPNRLYRNDRGALTTSSVWWPEDGLNCAQSVAWGDVDSDGDLDLAVGNGCGGLNIVYLNQTPSQLWYPGQLNYVTLNLYSDPVQTFSQSVTALAPADFYAVPGIREHITIPISYTISDPGSSSAWRVSGFFSPDGGGRWLSASATDETLIQNVASGVEQVYIWDVGQSGFFGQSDNMVFRLKALPGGKLPSQWPFVAAHTFPFRVRGTQVRVVDDFGQPVRNALVYRLPVGQTSGGQRMGNDEAYFLTSAQGYLSGRGELEMGDRLIALWPVTQGDKYTLYYTSAPPTATGLDAFTVSQSGVQTLTVSAAYPLLLFDLDVSLEWDASKDPPFLTQLEENLAKTSAALYDWTNGQAALGQVSVYQAKENWDEADVRVFASNQVRPVANRGGIVNQTTVLSFTHPITFTPGEIRIGPAWNRYGDPQPIGDDWPHVLAHELGHYALFLEDTYLGLDPDRGLLVPVGTCTHTAMSDPYLYSEFRYDDGAWEDECGSSLAEMPEWGMIQLVYEDLHQPPPGNTGPTAMPFAFTQIEIEPAPDHPHPLLDDFFVALDHSLADGRAYLRHPDQGLVDLGRPVANEVLARGARDGDELCVFAEAHFACSTLSNSQPPQLDPQPAWRPEIWLTPVDTSTLQIWVDDGSSSSLTATLYPDGEAPQPVTFTSGVTQTVTLNQPAVEVLVDIQGGQPGQERVVTGYAVGAGPGHKHDHGGPGHKHDHGGPFSSGDGSVLIYPPENLPPDAFVVLQTATSLPQLPPGLKPIGRAYRVRSSVEDTDFTGASLTFQYLGLEVLLAGGPDAEESLAVHYWDGASWTRLDTILNPTQNFASAPLPGPGLYVLTVGRLAPQISAITPAWGDSGQVYTLTISGDNFMQPLAVNLQGEAGGYPLTVTGVSSQVVTVKTPLELPVDLYDLEVINAGGLSDTLLAAFALYTAQPQACFFDDFQSGMGKWATSGEWGIVRSGDGREAATDSPGASYLNAQPGTTRTTTITSQPFSLLGCTNPALAFAHDYRLAIGPGDYQDWGWVEISTDDGQTWQLLESCTGGGSYVVIAADEWSQVNWGTEELNLAQAGVPTDSTTVRLRFNLVVDAEGSDRGWIIDQVLVATGQSQPPSKIYLPIVLK